MSSKILLLPLLSTLFFSFKGIFVKFAYDVGVSTDVMLFYRYFFSGLILWTVVLLSARRKTLKKLTRKNFATLLFLSFFGYYLASKFDFLAIEEMGVGISRMIVFTFPIFVVVFVSMIKRAFPSREQLISMGIVQTGLLLVLGSGFSVDNITFWGVLFSLLAAVTYAVYITHLGEQALPIDSITLIAFVSLFALIIVSIDGAFDHTMADFKLSSEGLFWTFAIGTVATIFPLVLFAESVKKLGSSITAIVAASGPIFSLSMANYFFGETYEALQLIGIGIIVLAVCYLNLSSKKKFKQQP